MVRATALLVFGLSIVAAPPVRAQPYPEGDTLAERQVWAREHPEYKPFDLPLSAEDRAKYVACEEKWGPSCDAMRERYQEKAAAAIGGDRLPKGDLSVQQKWARQNADWMPFGVPMTETDRNNYVICLEQPQWEGCAKIRGTYEKKKEAAAPGKKAPPAGKNPPGASAAAPVASSSPDGPGAADETPEPDASPPPGEEAAARARAGGDKAMSRARGLGEAFKKELRGDAGGAPGGGPKTDKAPGGAPAERDLLPASYSGYGASLAALGLVVGRDEAGRPAPRRADGGPATAEDLAALKARIATEPGALMRRPDFFFRLPRVRFQELKEAYRSRPELRDGVFRDVGLSASGRDFERVVSCEALSGACAPHAKASYRKGDLVPPEELAAIHRRLRGGDPDSDFEDEGPGDEWESEDPAASAPAPGETAEAATAASASERARAVVRAIERLAGAGEAAKDNTGGPGAAGAARLAWGEVPGAAVLALERGRGRLSAAGAGLFVLAVLLLSRRST